MTELDTLAAEAIIGDEADKFLRSDLGKAMLGIAEQEAMAATEELKKADPSKAESIRDLQNKIWRAEGFADWLRSLAHAGEIALKTMEIDEAHE
jgi:hypothetical protein